MTPKRQRAQTKILDLMTTLDPSGYNTKIYQDKFEAWSDKEFETWMVALRDHHHVKIVCLAIPLKVVITTNNALAAAKLVNVEIFQRLRLWDPVGKRYCMTPQTYMVLKLPIRRLKQYLQDGLSVPDSDKRLNPLTDQVVKPDKGSAISFPQAQMIAEKGLTTTLHEMMSIRGGDLEAYSRMKAEIEEQGSSTTDVMQGTSGVKSVQTLRTLLTALHLDSNL